MFNPRKRTETNTVNLREECVQTARRQVYKRRTHDVVSHVVRNVREKKNGVILDNRSEIGVCVQFVRKGT